MAGPKESTRLSRASYPEEESEPEVESSVARVFLVESESVDDDESEDDDDDPASCRTCASVASGGSCERAFWRLCVKSLRASLKERKEKDLQDLHVLRQHLQTIKHKSMKLFSGYK